MREAVQAGPAQEWPLRVWLLCSLVAKGRGSGVKLPGWAWGHQQLRQLPGVSASVPPPTLLGICSTTPRAG